MTGKQKLEMILSGGVPDTPPHWELVFQIQKEMFGMDRSAVAKEDWPAFDLDVLHRVVDEFGWAAVRGGYDVAEIKRTKDSLGSKALVPAYEGEGVFWMPTGENMVDFAVRLYERMDDLQAEARAKCDRAKEFFPRAVDAGADFFVVTYDFGYNDAPFISPEHFRELVAPYLTEIVETVHGLDRKVILHSDGCISRLLDQIHATGIDGYQSVDPQGHMDIEQVRRDYPDWILMGNVACNMLQDADEASIRASVRNCMTHGGVGKRYIFSTSNCIFAGMPPESYRIMLDEYRRIVTEREAPQPE